MRVRRRADANTHLAMLVGLHRAGADGDVVGGDGQPAPAPEVHAPHALLQARALVDEAAAEAPEGEQPPRRQHYGAARDLQRGPRRLRAQLRPDLGVPVEPDFQKVIGVR